MKHLALVTILFAALAATTMATANQKGETAHPTSTKKYTYE